MLLLVPEFDRDLQSLHDRISMKVPRKSLKSLINPFFYPTFTFRVERLREGVGEGM